MIVTGKPTNFAMMKSLLLLTLPTCLILFLVLEITTRLVFPAAEFPSYFYDPEDRILKFAVSQQREGTFTMGALAQARSSWRINNAGWNSAIDYEPLKRKPRIALIGDSYIEALQVNVDQSLAGELRRLIGSPVDVYAFGISGAPLSQYLQMARYVWSHYDPDIVVVNVVHNDFDESLCAVKRQAGMLCLKEEGQTLREATIQAYEPDPKTRVARHSSAVRFAVVNLQILAKVRDWLSVGTRKPSFNANIDPEQVSVRAARIQRATEHVLETFRRESGGRPVLFVMDAPRRDIYAGTMETSSVRWLNEMMNGECAKQGLPFIDLTGAFTHEFAVDHQRFESEFDWHWNEHGHRIAAREVLQGLQRFHLLEYDPKPLGEERVSNSGRAYKDRMGPPTWQTEMMAAPTTPTERRPKVAPRTVSKWPRSSA